MKLRKPGQAVLAPIALVLLLSSAPAPAQGPADAKPDSSAAETAPMTQEARKPPVSEPAPMTQEAQEPPMSGSPPDAATAPAGGGMMPIDYEEPRTFAAPWQSRPTLVRVAVLNATGVAGRGNQAAVLLMEVRRIGLERQMGMRLELVNASNVPTRVLPHSVIYYRPGYLRAALALAEALPGDQALEPMKPEHLARAGIDLEIWLGKDLP